LNGLINGQAAVSPRTDTATTLLQLLIRAAPNLSVHPNHLLDIVIHHLSSMQAGEGMEVHNVRGARAYYTDVGRRQIGGGLELWQGFFQLVRHCEDDF
jgi:hypothetical protein